MRHVIEWNGVELPEALTSVPKGRYVLVAVDDPQELTEDEEAGLEAAIASARAGRLVSSADAYRHVMGR